MSDLRYLASMQSAVGVTDNLDAWLRRSRDHRPSELELERALVQGASPVHIWGSWAAWLCGHLAELGSVVIRGPARDAAALFADLANAPRSELLDIQGLASRCAIGMSSQLPLRNGLTAIGDLVSATFPTGGNVLGWAVLGWAAPSALNEARFAFSRIAQGDTPCSEKYEQGGHAFLRQAAEMFSVAVRRAVEAKR